MKTKPEFIYFWGALFLTLLFLILAALASNAAPMPPMPPVVKRPAPLHSPKGSGAMWGTPMLRFVPASYPAAPVLCKLALGVNFFGCDTNQADCVLYDVTHLLAQQRAGMGVTLEFADSVTATEWTWVVIFSSSPTARIVEAEWIQPVDQRPWCRIFRARETAPFGNVGLGTAFPSNILHVTGTRQVSSPLARSAMPTIRVKSPEVRAWTRPK